MAKKDKTGKRIPKTIAGLKIPKELRKSGEALIATAASPQGRKLISAGLAMAAATIASKAHAPTRAHGAATDDGLQDKPVTDTAPHRPEPPVPPVPPSGPTPPVPPAAPVPPEGGEQVPFDPERIAGAVSAAAGAFFDGLFGRKR